MSGKSRSKVWAVIGGSLVVVGLLIRLAIAFGGSHQSTTTTVSPPPTDDGAMTVKPGDYSPPRYICEHLDFKEFASVFQLQGVRDGYNTGLEPEVVSGSMCKQPMSRGGTNLVNVTVHCSAWRDVDKAIDEFGGLEALDGSPEAVTGLGDQAFRYRAPNGPTVGMKVRAGNLGCEVEAEPGAPLTDAEIDGSFTAMTQLLQTLIPKLGPVKAP
ncbi:hypothetical protein PV721_32640 [Streptomyces sp. MB09-01]|uniref:hypothetical protein n=1 Tax=Streptomyces sp. MB09-01 TaxID=3028666 RepID=UPI0029B3B058|nr:hypothetical protein [Streptomyces sp. MB09-01]MDX3538998.1 hypothetical protein [Streptomyces sp. MB09-01]